MTKSYLTMRPNELHNALVKRIPEPEMRELKKAEIEQAKKIQRFARLSNFQHKRLWGELMSPLRYELSNAKVGARWNGKHLPERQTAFNAYIRLMTKLESKLEALQLHRDDEGKLLTPSQVAQELDIPNKGVHWTDWIPLTKRTEVEVLFEAIPHTPKAKRKIPFKRTQRPNTKLKDTLLKRTIKELGNEESEQAIEPTGVRAERIKKMKRAITLIRALTPTDAVPHTWHGLTEQIE
jgi:hypothetical protein